MAAVALDTLAFVKRLQSAGVEQGKAEAFVEAISKVVFVEVATKADLRDLGHRIVARLTGVLAIGLTIAVAILGALITLA